MDPPRAARLRKAGEPVIVEHVAGAQGDLPDVIPDASGVGSRSTRSSSGRSRSPARTGHGFQSITPRLTRPDEVRLVVGQQLPRGPSAREGDDGRLQPLGRAVADALLEERLAPGALDVALEHRRAVAQVIDERRRRPRGRTRSGRASCGRLGKEDLGRVGYAHLVPGGLDDRVVGHRPDRMTNGGEWIPDRPVVAPDRFKRGGRPPLAARSTGAGWTRAGGPVTSPDRRAGVSDRRTGRAIRGSLLDALGFDARMRAARAVVTGEGQSIRQSLAGSSLSEVSTRARQAGVPSFAIVGEPRLDAFDHASSTWRSSSRFDARRTRGGGRRVGRPALSRAGPSSAWATPVRAFPVRGTPASRTPRACPRQRAVELLELLCQLAQVLEQEFGHVQGDSGADHDPQHARGPRGSPGTCTRERASRARGACPRLEHRVVLRPSSLSVNANTGRSSPLVSSR